MYHLRRTAFSRLLYALFYILKSHAFVRFSCYSELLCYLTPSILCILLEEIGTGIPALATAYAALSIYNYVDHKDHLRLSDHWQRTIVAVNSQVALS